MTDPPPHPCELRPATDLPSRQIVRHAITELAHARRLDPDHPAVHIHLIGSLIDQAETERSTAITNLIDSGYTPLEIAILLRLG